MGNAEYMGTHPIFESDFDCLTECCLVEFAKLSAQWFVMDPQVPQNIHQLLLIQPLSQDGKKSSSVSFWAFTSSLVHWQTSRANRSVNPNLIFSVIYVRIKTIY